MGLGCIAVLVALLKVQGPVTDTDIDTRVARVAKETRNSGLLAQVYDANPTRVIWNYKRANGLVRSRILSSVFYNRSRYAEILSFAVKEKDIRLRSLGAELLGMINLGPNLDRSALIRQIAARGARFGLPQSPKYLVPMLKDGDPAVRLTAAVSLVDIQDVRAIPLLVSYLGHSEKYSHVFERSGSGRQIEPVLARWGEPAIRQVEPKLSSKDSAVRASAIVVMMSANAPKLFEYGKLLLTDKDPLVRIHAYSAVGWEKRPEAIPILLKGMNDREKVKGINTSVSLNVAMVLSGQSNPFSHGWPEGEEALKKWREEHPGQY
jgi:HEAT repeat protein